MISISVWLCVYLSICLLLNIIIAECQIQVELKHTYRNIDHVFALVIEWTVNPWPPCCERIFAMMNSVKISVGEFTSNSTEIDERWKLKGNIRADSGEAKQPSPEAAGADGHPLMTRYRHKSSREIPIMLLSHYINLWIMSEGENAFEWFKESMRKSHNDRYEC